MTHPHLFLAGHHLKVACGLYTHHGIYIGNNRVVHYAGKGAGLFDVGNSCVQNTSLESFADGRPVMIMLEPDAVFSRDDIVERALARVGEDDYSLLFNNCEHFVNWCIHGESKSYQARRAGATAGVVGGATWYRNASASKNTADLAASIRLAGNGVKAFTLSPGIISTLGGSSVTAGIGMGSGGTAVSAGLMAVSGVSVLPAAAAGLVVGGVIWGAGKLFDWW